MSHSCLDQLIVAFPLLREGRGSSLVPEGIGVGLCYVCGVPTGFVKKKVPIHDILTSLFTIDLFGLSQTFIIRARLVIKQ
jgi:hypothetical protein